MLTYTTKQKQGENGEKDELLVVVERKGKVLPLRRIRRDGIQLLAVLVEELELVLVCARFPDDGAGLELDLVGGVICLFVPYVLSMRQSISSLAPTN